jgi:TIR domain
VAEAVSTFISYSRTDSEFVDRLEADLRARGFNTWVDRRKLEGTREWQPQIDQAITAYPMMIVVLSPDAIASPYVRHEYEYAHQAGKRIVTLLHKPNLPTVPSELSEIQWVDFVNHPYETALVELIDGCQDPFFEQASDPRTLYNQAHDLESTDPERAAILYQRLLNRAPTYAGGRAKVDLDRLNHQLYPQRAQGLREQAEAARKEGQYGAEAGALKALIALGGQDRAILAWAEEYLPIAEKNSAWLDTYENVKHCVEVGDKERARDLLTDLWQQEHAPFFRDPAGVASGLGLKVPITYEQWKEEQQADAAEVQNVQNARSIRDTEIARLSAEFRGHIKQETEQNGQIVKTVLRLTQAWKEGQVSGNDRSEIETIERSLSAKTTALDPSAKALLSRFVLCGQAYLAAYDEEQKARIAILSKDRWWFQSIWGMDSILDKLGRSYSSIWSQF